VVGCVDRRFERPARAMRGDPEGAGDATRPAVAGVSSGRQRETSFFGHGPRRTAVRVREEKDELLASPAGDEVFAAKNAAQ
jgi:hypothetical protein